jgi:hypothetical protein
MKTVVWFSIALFFLTIGGASAQDITLDGAGLTINEGGTLGFEGDVSITKAESGDLMIGGGTLVLSSSFVDSGTLIVGNLTLNPSSDPETYDGTVTTLNGTLSLTDGTLNLSIDPGTLTLGTLYNVALPADYTFDPGTTNGLTFNLQATPEPPTVLLLAMSALVGAGAFLRRSLSLRTSTRS